MKKGFAFNREIIIVVTLLLMICMATFAFAQNAKVTHREPGESINNTHPDPIHVNFLKSSPAKARKISNFNASLACLTDVYVDAVNGNDANAGDTPAAAKKTIQAGIDEVCPGGTVHVYPGSYSEAATNRFVLGSNGPHQFGLFIEKDGVTVQGVNAGGTPIMNYNGAQAEVETNATNNFGFSGIFVEGDGVTIRGLKILPNVAGDNKTIEIIGDDFTLKYCDITTGYSVYFNDWQYNDNGTPGDDSDDHSHVRSYAVKNNLFRNGGSIDLASGAGFSGPVYKRMIRGNVFEEDVSGQNWPFISFNGSGTGVPWFVYSVGGAKIEDNEFSNSYNTPDLTSAHIRARGDYDNSEFDWRDFWKENKFNKAVVTLAGYPFDVRTYSYPNAYGTFNNVRRIGATIQGEIDNAVAGDKVLVNRGTYQESPVIGKSLTLVSDDGKHFTVIELQTGPSYLGGLTIKGDGSDVTVDGFTIKGFDAVGAGLASSNIVIETGASNTPDEVVIKNNLVKVGNIGASANGDDGIGLITYYNETLNVGSLTVEDNSFEPLNAEAFRAFYINPGVNKFVFHGNEISGKFNGTAITQAKDGLVEKNTITGAGVAGSRSAGLGTWGYPTPSVYGATVFRKNVVTGSRGISIYETETVTVENNFLSNNDWAVRVLTAVPLAFDASTIHITSNSITGSHFFGVEKDASVSGVLDAEKNWWGSNTGPTHAGNPGGTGDPVSDDVDFDPWLCSGADTSPYFGFQPASSTSPCSAPPVGSLVFLAKRCVTLDGHGASEGSIHSNGDIEFERGRPSTLSGHLTAVDDIVIEAKNTVNGDATAGDHVIIKYGATVSGVVTKNAGVAFIPLPNPSFSSSGDNHIVPQNGSLALPPGSYRSVLVKKNGSLHLSHNGASGDYFFLMLEIEFNAKLSLDVTNGPVKINVVYDLDFGKQAQVLISTGETGSSEVTFTTLQKSKVTIGHGARVLGEIIAPKAEVILAKNSRFKGAITAEEIFVDEGAVFFPHGSSTPLPSVVNALALEDSEQEAMEAPVTEYELSANYPNPFNPSTTIRFALPEAGAVTLRIYSLTGQLVRELVHGEMAAGRHSASWNGRNDLGAQVTSGFYFYRLDVRPQNENTGFTQTRRMTLIK